MKKRMQRILIAQPEKSQRDIDRHDLRILATLLRGGKIHPDYFASQGETWAEKIFRYTDDAYPQPTGRPSMQNANFDLDVLFWLYQISFDELPKQSAARVADRLRQAGVKKQATTIRTDAQREERRKAARRFIANQLWEHRDCYRDTVKAALIQEFERHISGPLLQVV